MNNIQNKNQSHASHHSIANVESFLKIVGGAVLVYAAANISIPLQPVPITLQTFAILLLALTYRRVESMATILTYVGTGVMGAPIFAGGQFGPLALLSPTGGYIVGFILAVYIVGLMKEKFGTEKFLPLLLASMMGGVAIFASGIFWLTHLFDFEKAITVGLMPFILPEIVKVFLLAATLRAVGFFKK